MSNDRMKGSRFSSLKVSLMNRRAKIFQWDHEVPANDVPRRTSKFLVPDSDFMVLCDTANGREATYGGNDHERNQHTTYNIYCNP